MADTGERSLRRQIGVSLGVLVVINATIGTGIFKTPAGIARLSGSMSAALGVWVVGAIIALTGALALAELAAALPRSGGIYEYLRRTYGSRVAFVFGWAKITLLIPSAVGGFAKLAGEALPAVFGLAPDAHRDPLISLGIIAGAALINVAPVRASTTWQGAVTVSKYAGVLLLATIGLVLPVHAAVASASPPAFLTVPTVGGLFAALVSVMWAYDGWADLSSLAAEVKEPGRTLPRALIGGTACVAIVYLLANVSYARALGLGGLRASTTVAHIAAAHMATMTLGDVGRRAFAVLIVVSCAGGCMSSLLTGSRVFVPMATDGVFVRWLGVVSKETGVPVLAVIVPAILGGIYVLFRSFEQLTDGFVVGYFPFYMLAIASVLILRVREPALERPFRTPFLPVVAAVFLAGAGALLVGAVKDANRSTTFALAILAAGLPIGEIRRRTRA